MDHISHTIYNKVQPAQDAEGSNGIHQYSTMNLLAFQLSFLWEAFYVEGLLYKTVK